MIIGTAGHIDHGKSSLVTALTGAAMDRLAEERRREITIDLNFASLELRGGRIAGVVDVPGHEDFVRTMVAGASGINLALLVIAADEGIMPQTEEHLAILEQLAIPAAIPVVTKLDLVEPEWLQLVMLDISERLARSSIPFQAPIAVSARTGEGIEHLRQQLSEHAGTLGPRSAGDVFRLPVDRVFSLPGVGTVVTGTAWSGRVRVGSPVIMLPSGLEGRVRSIGAYGRQVEQSEAGARTALGIVGIDRAQIRRGDVLVTADAPWTSTSALDVELALQASASKPLGRRTRVRVLLGTSEVMGRVLPRSATEPGKSGMARLSLEKPLVARAQDRFVIRSYSPVSTIGGGTVLDPLPPRRRTVWPRNLASTDPQERLVSLISRRPGGIPTRMLPILLGIPPASALSVARKEPSIRLIGEVWVATARIERVGSRALALLKEYHRLHPSAVGMPLETLRHSLHAGDQVVATALLDFARSGRLRRIDGVVALAGFTPRVAGGDAEIDRVVGIISEANLTPPSIPELERSTGRRDLLALLRLAAATGRVEAVERDRYYSREALEHFTKVLKDMGEYGAIHPAQVRDRLGISRKYLIPLLEWADGRGITVREGEGRTLKRGLGSEV
jgi:selenocysteine-specific elongation factor